MKIEVAGVYQTKFGELWDKSVADLMAEAAAGAIRDAGIEIEDIETIYVGSMLAPLVAGQSHLGALIAEVLGVKMPVTGVEAACASGGVAVRQAALVLESGRYKIALVIGVEKMTDVSSEEIAEALMGAASSEAERKSGITFPGLYALMARAYLNKYKLEAKDLAGIAVKNHNHACLNDLAHLPFCVSEEEVVSSPVVADPLRLLDCAPISDGAAAVVLRRSGKNKRGKKVWLVGSGQASDTMSLAKRESLIELAATKMASKEALQEAGVSIKEVDVLEVHDCFSIAEVLAIEDLGLASKGEGLVWLKKHGGMINTSGGLKACGHPVGATGVKQIVEVARQLRGELGQRQVKGARLGLTHNVGGSGGTAVIHVLSN